MVFIAIGAFKAAKAAKREYDKDKKRSQIIAPLDNSRRNEFDNAPASASPDWWSSDQPAEPQSQQPPVSHNSFGAWSRDQLIEQVAEQQSREEEYDTRFREQLSNSSASLGSSRVPSASHSPSVAVARTRSELEQAYHSGESPKQILPPTISQPSPGHDEEQPEATASHTDASNSAPNVLKAKPPRPGKQSTCVEGSYEAMLKSSSTSFEQTRHVARKAVGSSSTVMRPRESSGDNGVSQLGTAFSGSNAVELVDGSFESALRSRTVTMRSPLKSNLGNANGPKQPGAQSTSAFPSSAKPKRLARRSSMPVHPTTANSPYTEDGRRTQTLEKQASQSSAFANVSTSKATVKRTQRSSNSPDELQPVHSKTMGAAEGSNPVQETQRSAFQREGVHTKTRRKPRGATVLGSRTIPAPRTTLQDSTDAVSTKNPPNRAGGDTVVGTSCMSAEGTMKKRRGRGPPRNN